MKHANGFSDHYEAFQLNPNADSETIDRVYRILAKRYHPDNQETGDAAKFETMLHTGFFQIRNSAQSMMPHTRNTAAPF